MLFLTILIQTNSVIANQTILFIKALWIDIKLKWIMDTMVSILSWTATTTEYKIKFTLMEANLFNLITTTVARSLLKVSNTITIN